RADELRVGDADRPGRRVDADDPQTAEVPLPLAAVAVHEGPGVMDRLAGRFVAVAALAAVTLGPLQNSVAASPRFETLLCARHLLAPFRAGCEAGELPRGPRPPNPFPPSQPPPP